MIDPEIVKEHSNEAWCYKYFISFLSRMAEGLGPGRSADFHFIFLDFMSKAEDGYRNREVGPLTLAPIILLMKLGSLLTELDLEPKLERHCFIVICQAIQAELENRKLGITDRICQAALTSVLYRPLMPAWKQLIDFCYTAYKEPLERLRTGSSSFAHWERAIRDIWPLLWLSKIVPTHDIEYADHVQIPEP